MNSEVKLSNYTLFLHQLVCAGGADAISKTIVAPLERIKVILQAQSAMVVTEKDKVKGFGDALTSIISKFNYKQM